MKKKTGSDYYRLCRCYRRGTLAEVIEDIFIKIFSPIIHI